MTVNVNAVVERVVEVEAPAVDQPQGVPVNVVTVYDYPVDDEVVTLSAEEHLTVTHAPDPTSAFDRVVEARDAVPTPVEDDEPEDDDSAPEDFGDTNPEAQPEYQSFGAGEAWLPPPPSAQPENVPEV